MLVKTTQKSPQQIPLVSQAQSSVSQRGVDKQADNPLHQPVWQPVLPRAGAMSQPGANNTGHNFAHVPVLPPAAIMQPKLTISQPNDKYEQEADRVADQVIRMPEKTVQSEHSATPNQKLTGQDGLQRLCSNCSGSDQEEKLFRSPTSLPQISPMTKQTLSRYKFSDLNDSQPPKDGEPEIIQQDDDEANIQKKPTSGTGIHSAPGRAAMTTTDSVQHSIENSNKSGGAPLSAETRDDMESRFGHSFSNVRVHADGAAGDIARQVNARAFTYGHHVYFAPGEYQSRTNNGKHLLAHELTHVVQQGMGKPGGVRAKQIQRTEAETLQHCPAYWKWETPRNVETYNCAGLAHRTYDYKSLLDTGNLLAANTTCGPNKIKHWLWRYNVHLEDYSGNRITPPSPDFHTVAGMIDPRGTDPVDVYSKNGKRPVYGPGTGTGFRPPTRAQARENNANEQLATDSNGRPIYKVRSNFQTDVACLNCPSPRRP